MSLSGVGTSAARRAWALAGYFGCGNFGDDWLYEAWLRQAADVKSCAGAVDPEIVGWKRARPRLKGLGRLEKVIFLGGLLQDLTSLRSFAYYLAMAHLARRLARDGVIFEGASFGPLLHDTSRRLLRRFLDDSDKSFFCVRDRASMNLLLKLNPSVRCQLALDPTWTVPLGCDVALCRAPSDYRRPVGFFLNGSLRAASFLEILTDAIRRTAASRPVILFLCDRAHDNWQASLICKRLGREITCVAYGGAIGPFLGQIRACAGAVSWRLHGAIAAMRLGVPAACVDPGPGAPLDKLGSLFLPDDVQFEWFYDSHQLGDWIESLKTH